MHITDQILQKIPKTGSSRKREKQITIWKMKGKNGGKKKMVLIGFVWVFSRSSLIQMRMLVLQAKKNGKARFCMHFLLSYLWEILHDMTVVVVEC